VPDGFEDLCPGIGHIGRDAHLGHDLEQALADALDEVPDRLVTFLGIAASDLLQGFQCQIGMHRFRPVTGQQGKMMRLARSTGFDHQTDPGTLVTRW